MNYILVLWNDDVNTFDDVVDALVTICAHSADQAEQCALIVHHRGSYPIAHGTKSTIEEWAFQLRKKDLVVTVDQTPHLEGQ